VVGFKRCKAEWRSSRCCWNAFRRCREKIKGQGTEVRCRKRTGGLIKLFLLLGQLRLKKFYAKSSISRKNGLKYGIIYLLNFYIDFEDETVAMQERCCN
jgi:hypothetical protein